ncbi:hypothetical protein LTR85_010680 [Meristemomyces frigidus]|nr:hypothetical protein LTR85_010680 [Meristemomyces frigidus]
MPPAKGKRKASNNEAAASSSKKQKATPTSAATAAEPARRESAYIDLLSSVVAIHVGDGPETFTIHSGLLREQSDYFAEMLQNDEPTLHLPDVPLRTFRLFMAWLYAGKLLTPKEALEEKDSVKVEKDQEADSEADSEAETPAWIDLDLVSLYIFGREHQVRRLKNAVITAMHREHARMDFLTDEDAIHLQWDGCGLDSTLSHFMATERATYGLQNLDAVPDYFDTLPRSFFTKVLRVVATLNSRRSHGHDVSKLGNPCRWHDHLGAEGETKLCWQSSEDA